MKGVFDDAYAIFFSDFPYKYICFGCSFELPQLVDAIQIGINNICIYIEVKIKVHWL